MASCEGEDKGGTYGDSQVRPARSGQLKMPSVNILNIWGGAGPGQARTSSVLGKDSMSFQHTSFITVFLAI